MTMQKTRLKRILNATYELEALLELALRRNPAPMEMDSLIAEKADAIRRLVSEKEPEENIVEKTADETVPEPVSDPGPGPESSDEEPLFPEPGKTAEIPAAEETAAEPRHDLKRLFSLNDRFRYARELFGGDRRKFDEALDEASRIADRNAVRGYFLDKFGWDAENESVAEFLAKAEGGETR